MSADKLEALGVEVEHHFLPHLYAKRTFIPAGVWLRQHRHNYPHASHLVAGRCVVTRADPERGAVSEQYEAPATILIAAGMEHEVQALTPVEWYCVHITDDTDPAVIDAATALHNPAT